MEIVCTVGGRDYAKGVQRPMVLTSQKQAVLGSPRVSGVLVLQLFKWLAIALADQLLLVLLRPVNLECSVGAFVLATSLH